MTQTTEIPTPEQVRKDLDEARERFGVMEDKLRRGVKDAPDYETYNRARGEIDYLEKALEGAEAAANAEARAARDEKAAKVRTQVRKALRRKGDAVLEAKAQIGEAVAAIVAAIEEYNDEVHKVGAKVIDLRLPDEPLDGPEPESVAAVHHAAPHVPITTVHPSALIQAAVRDAIKGLDTGTDRISGTQLAALLRTLDAPQVYSPTKHFLAVHEHVSRDEK